MQSFLQVFKLWDNPLFLKGFRARLRPRQMLGWGVITFVFTLMMTLIFFNGATNRANFVIENAAKATFLPVLVIQALIMFLLGTRAVAVGITMERDAGIVDFHRMTPMQTTPKIFGYLFGLAAREYFMFAMTIPFTVFATVVGKLSPTRVLHLYMIFFCSVWLYHITGFTVGMLAKRARSAGIMAQLAIIGLYIFMPQFARWGFTFLGYLTVIPVYSGIIMGELSTFGTVAQSQRMLETVKSWQFIGFYNMELHATVFTLMIQGLLFTFMFLLVRRKFEDERQHAFSKPLGLAFFTTLQFLVLGSLWPFLTKPELSSKYKIVTNIRNFGNASLAYQVYLFGVFFIFFLIAAGSAFLVINSIVPTWESYIKGLRRRKKLKLPRIPLMSDAATGLYVCFGMILLSSMSYALMWWLASSSGTFFQNLPSISLLLGVPFLFGGTLFCIQNAREFFSTAGFFVFLFFFWIVPGLLALLILSIGNAPLAASYTSITIPLVSLAFSVFSPMEQIFNVGGMPMWVRGNASTLMVVGIFVQLLPGIVIFSMLKQKKLKAMQLEKVIPPSQ